MPVTTVSAAVHITPVVVKTFLKHYKTKGQKLASGDTDETATDDIFFDEGFNIVKAFIELGTQNTVESLQAFTNTHVPPPPWAAAAPIVIPISTCNAAADLLIDWFGPEDLKYVVGGHKWWQVRGLDGVDAEWITEKEFLQDLDGDKVPERKLPWEEETVLRMEHLDTVMLYVHGGAYFWGSINSHRYQMIRYARKFHGRLFAVNYRKAPQYPWPCPLHDVIAAYLYLTRPPLDAPHKAVQPEKIVIAGDSAGAGLCIALLTVLRDLDMVQPAGAVLISPWVDLTHSFPSVMSNAGSDIIPPHGFIHKPSVTWPIQSQMSQTVITTETNPPPIPGHADETKPSSKRDHIAEALPQEPLPHDKVPTQASMIMLADIIGSSDQVHTANTSPIDRASGIQAGPLSAMEISDVRPHSIEERESKPSKVLMENPNNVPLELQSQIQIYATNEQLTHPLVSPLLQASLGNLCPLYILAGDGEVLVDEIMYLAHKAAHPASYPLRQGALRGSKRQQENAKRFTTPTNVHLQVYDGMPHVLTVFGYTESARYAYRTIAQFVKHVTQHTTYLGNFPFPELYKEVAFEESVCDSDSELVKITRSNSKSKSRPAWFHRKPKDKPLKEAIVEKGTEDPAAFVASGPALPSSNNVVMVEGADTGVVEPDKGEGTSSVPQTEYDVIMLRERVDIRGRIRPMEPVGEIPALRIPPNQIGLIREAPVRRWLQGQAMWDEQFKHRSKKVFEKRKKLEKKAERIIRRVTQQGLVVKTEASDVQASPERARGDVGEQDKVRPTVEPQGRRKTSRSISTTTGIIDENRRFGPLDLDDENPPPSAIAKRRDTPEALALLRKCVYHTAPVTHNKVPKRKTMEVIRATFDPSDHPVNPPPQSVSEQQVKANVIPMHGLRIWDTLVGYMMRKKAKGRAQRVVAAVGNGASGVVNGRETAPASQAIIGEEQEKQV